MATKDDLINYLGAKLPVTRSACKAVIDLLPEAMAATGYYMGTAIIDNTTEIDLSENDTAIEIDPVVEFMNTASGNDIDAIEGFGAATVDRVIAARPHTLETLTEMLSDAQMKAARAVLG